MEDVANVQCSNGAYTCEAVSHGRDDGTVAKAD